VERLNTGVESPKLGCSTTEEEEEKEKRRRRTRTRKIRRRRKRARIYINVLTIDIVNNFKNCIYM
jgi:hypothetical protein